MDVIGMLKQSCTGLTQEQFVKKAEENGIKHPFKELGPLIAQGLARFDADPEPGRFKATSLAFK